MENEWSELSKEEKRVKRMEKYISGEGINFRNAEAEKRYKERVTRMVKVSRCEEPDRVPVVLPTGSYPAYYAGYNLKQVMYDYDLCVKAWRKFMENFYDDMDNFMDPRFVYSGKVMDLIDCKNYTWPGHGSADEVTTLQYVEAPYMKSDEYDYFLKDPSDYGFRVLTTRIIGAAESFQYFPPLSTLIESPLGIAAPFARADVRDSFRRLIEAGEEMERQQKTLGEFSRESLEMGFPAVQGGVGILPFDFIGDFLRGTEGMAIDMYRRPETLIEAIDMITELSIPRYISAVNASGGHHMAFPLHRGDDTFMSRKQFEKFYWPSIKKVMDTLIEEGIQMTVFAEGIFNDRLEYLGDFPRGWVTWLFDQTDMARAKKIIGDTCCISGNVPGSLVITGTPQEIKDYCRKLIDTCAPGGGYILAGGCAATEVKNPENFRTFMEAAVEYGTY